MDNIEFIQKIATLLVQTSPEQRAQLVTMVQNFGNTTEAGAMDRSIGRPPANIDEMRRADPDYGKSFDERFPNMKRLLNGSRG